MIKQAPSAMEIWSALQNKEVKEVKPMITPMQQQIKPVVDIVQFREAYGKATKDWFKWKKSDFALQLEKEWVQVEWFEQYKDQMLKNNVAKDKRKSYFWMIANVIDTRYQRTKKQLERTSWMIEWYDASWSDSPSERMWKNIDVLKNWTATIWTPIWETVWWIVDIAMNSLWRWIQAITPDSVEKYVTKQWKEVWDNVKDKSFVQDAIWFLWKSAEDYNNWAMNNPDEAQMLANIMNIADVALVWWGSKVAKEVVEWAWKKTMRLARVDEAKALIQNKLKPVSEFIKWNPIDQAKDEFTNYLATKVWWLTKETVETIKSNPIYELAEKGELTRRSLGQEVLSALESRRWELSEVGSLYNNFKNPWIIVDLNAVKQNVKSNILDKYKIKITKEWFDFRSSKFANDSSDQWAIIKALDLLTEDSLTADVALNRRQAISKMSRFWSDVSWDGASVVREIRHQLNEQMHKDIKWLKAVDNQISPEIQQIDSLLKDYYNKDWSLKDNFYSSITNITNKGKELKYDRLNQIIPDIEERVWALRALENVERAMSVSVGAYDRIVMVWSAVTFWASVWWPIWWTVWLYYWAKYSDVKNIVELLKKRGGAWLAVAKKVEWKKALTQFDNEVIQKAIQESREQASDIATRWDRRLPFLVEDVQQKIDDIVPELTEKIDETIPQTPSVTPQIIETPRSPIQWNLNELLKNATDEELKASWLSSLMIKQFRKKNPLNKVWTTESATQSIPNEVLQENSLIDKVDNVKQLLKKNKEYDNLLRFLDTTDDELLLLDPDNYSKFEQSIYNGIVKDIAKSDETIKKMEYFKKRVETIWAIEQRIGKVWKNKVNRAYANKQSIDKDRAKEKIITEMQEFFDGMDTNEAYDLFDSLQ